MEEVLQGVPVEGVLLFEVGDGRYIGDLRTILVSSG